MTNLKLALKGNERVFDIGCGDGKVTVEIAKQLPNGSVLGIDKSEEMIRFVQENFPSRKYINLMRFRISETQRGFCSCANDEVGS